MTFDTLKLLWLDNSHPNYVCTKKSERSVLFLSVDLAWNDP